MNTAFLDQDHISNIGPCVATLGFFDGVHLGHRFLIEQVINEARVMELPSIVITFDRHPREVLHQDYQPELLTTLDSKITLLEHTGVNRVVVLRFDETMAQLSAKDFMTRVLRDQLNVVKLVIGYDNRFGHNQSEGFDDYVQYGREMGMDVMHSSAFKLNGIEISSSVVRSFLKEGEIELANRCLGYPYTITGKVVDGYKIGRKMGYPTANLDTQSSGQLVPADGVYATKVCIGDTENGLPGMTDIGTRPTFGGQKRTLETYIFNFNENIYGRRISLSFIKHIRKERKFDNVTLLVEQLKKDESIIEDLFNNKETGI
jgi:riboflavin kinase/FMN adenylyltransferase